MFMGFQNHLIIGIKKKSQVQINVHKLTIFSKFKIPSLNGEASPPTDNSVASTPCRCRISVPSPHLQTSPHWDPSTMMSVFVDYGVCVNATSPPLD
jgi:hypothetical protein